MGDLKINFNASNVQACRMCLATDVKMHSLQGTNLGYCVESIRGINEFYKGLPNYVCYECASILMKCNKLVEKSKTAEATLLYIFTTNEQITKPLIQEQNKSLNLQSSLNSKLLFNYEYLETDAGTNASNSNEMDTENKEINDVEIIEVENPVIEINSNDDNICDDVINLTTNDAEKNCTAVINLTSYDPKKKCTDVINLTSYDPEKKCNDVINLTSYDPEKKCDDVINLTSNDAKKKCDDVINLTSYDAQNYTQREGFLGTNNGVPRYRESPVKRVVRVKKKKNGMEGPPHTIYPKRPHDNHVKRLFEYNTPGNVPMLTYSCKYCRKSFKNQQDAWAHTIFGCQKRRTYKTESTVTGSILGL